MMHENREKASQEEFERLATHELYADYRHALEERRIRGVRVPLIEIFDSSSHWGRWDPGTRTIQIARKLLWHHPWYRVVAILKHEMAHQLVDEVPDILNIKTGGGKSAHRRQSPHGDLFQAACEKLGVPLEYCGATANLQEFALDWRLSKRDETSERMLERVRKLLALATSGNEHEAVSAMNRVREIYARYNLEAGTGDGDAIGGGDQPAFVHTVISTGAKRMEAHERKTISILTGHFFVEAILSQTYEVASGERHRSIVLLGKRENVLMAEYVYHFLLSQSVLLAERMMIDLAAQPERPPGPARLGQRRAHARLQRKSFRLGVLDGFAGRLAASEKVPAESASTKETAEAALISRALTEFNKSAELQKYLRRIFPRLHAASSARQRIDSSAYAAGKSAGQKLSLHRPVTGHTSNLGRRLGQPPSRK